jgi:hypothetical protein
LDKISIEYSSLSSYIPPSSFQFSLFSSFSVAKILFEMNYCYHNKKLLSVTRCKLARYVFVSILCFFSLFSFSSYVRGEESGGGDFANLIAESVVRQVIDDLFIPRFQPVRLLSLHRGYFLSGWEKGQSLTVGYSFAIGSQGSHPFLFSVSFNRTYERANLEFSVWPISFQFLPKFRLIRIGNIGGLVFGAGPILSFSKFPVSGEVSLNLILGPESVGPPEWLGVYFGLCAMDHLIKVNESIITPYITKYNFRTVVGFFIIKRKYGITPSDKFILDKFIFEWQLGLGESGIFMLFGFAFNIHFHD